jgi:hypothetical protein
MCRTYDKSPASPEADGYRCLNLSLAIAPGCQRSFRLRRITDGRKIPVTVNKIVDRSSRSPKKGSDEYTHVRAEGEPRGRR